MLKSLKKGIAKAVGEKIKKKNMGRALNDGP
jgi:hypothetical protein